MKAEGQYQHDDIFLIMFRGIMQWNSVENTLKVSELKAIGYK